MTQQDRDRLCAKLGPGLPVPHYTHSFLPFPENSLPFSWESQEILSLEALLGSRRMWVCTESLRALQGPAELHSKPSADALQLHKPRFACQLC